MSANVEYSGMGFALPTREEIKKSKAAKAAYYAFWLKTSWEEYWKDVGCYETKADLADMMKPCAVCALGTGNRCEDCGGPMCSRCEDDEECPMCIALLRRMRRM